MNIKDSRNLEDLVDDAQKVAGCVQWECKQRGIDILIYTTYRPPELQFILYLQGRIELSDLNKIRKHFGLWEVKNNRRVTYAKPCQSNHNWRMAFDGVPLNGGKPVWDSKDPVWQVYGECAKVCDGDWAGNWKRFKEFPHVQLASDVLWQNKRLMLEKGIGCGLSKNFIEDMKQLGYGYLLHNFAKNIKGV